MHTGFSKITAAVLAGGLGTRLRSSVADRPKVLALVNGRPFISFLLDRLARAGVGRTVLLTGYMGGMVEEELGRSHVGMELAYSREPSPLGTAGALRLALDHFSGSTTLVMNGDSIFTADLAGFAAWHEKTGAKAGMMLTRVPDVSRYGQVSLDADSRVTGFHEKGGTTGPGLINAGIYLLAPEMIASIPQGRPVSLESEMFPQWLGDGLYGFTAEGKFLDIGLPETYRAAPEFMTEAVS